MSVHHLTLKRFNDGLSLVILLLAVYIFFLPFIPQLAWWAQHSLPIVSKPVATAVAVHKLPTPQDDRLVIPAMDLNVSIIEGQTEAALNKGGVWRRPNASTPDKGGNTVLAGHRFSYSAPRGPFYFLDKVKPGDQIIVYWHGKAYIYAAKTSAEVPPSDGAVEAPTADDRLTLYTCTPLWSLKDRLVVVAERVGA